MKSGHLIGLAVLVFISAGFKSCGEKEKFPEYVDMIFMIPLTITPIKESYHVGDTLILEANFPDTLKEYYSGRYYKVQNLNFRSVVNTLELVSNSLYLSQVPGNSYKFTVLSEIGSLEIFGPLGGVLQFNYENERYRLKIKIVPKAESITCLSFTTFIFINRVRIDHIIDLGKTADGRKRIPILTGIYQIVNDGDNNFNLLQLNAKLSMDSVPFHGNIYTEKFGTFTFRVIE